MAAPPDPIPSVHVVTDLEQLKLLSDPLRLRILEPLCREARTTKQVAEILGESPTKLYHHIDLLEKAGLIRLEETRQKRGTLEKYYRAVATSFRAGLEVFSGTGEADDSWASMGAEALASAVEEARGIDVGRYSDDEPVMFVSARVQGSRAEVEAIRDRLESALEELTAGKPDSDESESDADRLDYRLVLGLFPLDPSLER